MASKYKIKFMPPALRAIGFDWVVKSSLIPPGTQRGEDGVAVVYNAGAGSTITFPAGQGGAMPDTSYNLWVRCYKAGGTNQGYSITNITVNGFDVIPDFDGFIDYGVMDTP